MCSLRRSVRSVDQQRSHPFVPREYDPRGKVGVMTEHLEVRDVVAAYGVATKAKLSNLVVIGAPENQLRAPLEDLVKSLAVVAGYGSDRVVIVGETVVEDHQTRPDYAVTINDTLVGFIEVKSPGKGADPRTFREQHDKEQ